MSFIPKEGKQEEVTERYDLKEGPIISLDPVQRIGYMQDEKTGTPYQFYFTARRLAVIKNDHADFGSKATRKGFRLRVAIRCVFTTRVNEHERIVVGRFAPADDWHTLDSEAQARSRR